MPGVMWETLIINVRAQSGVHSFIRSFTSPKPFSNFSVRTRRTFFFFNNSPHRIFKCMYYKILSITELIFLLYVLKILPSTE